MSYQETLRRLFLENRPLTPMHLRFNWPGASVVSLFGEIVAELDADEEAVFIPKDRTVVIFGKTEMRRAYRWEAEGRFYA